MRDGEEVGLGWLYGVGVSSRQVENIAVEIIGGLGGWGGWGAERG